MKLRTLIFLTILTISGSWIMAQINTVPKPEYKKFEKEQEVTTLVTITAGRENWNFTIYPEGGEKIYTVETSNIRQKDHAVWAGKEIRLDSTGMYFPDITIESSEIDEIRVNVGPDDKSAVIHFVHKNNKRTPRARSKSDIIKLWQPVRIEKEDFIRGSIISFFGDIDINGEVNRDVVAVFGDINIGGDAVVRGDVYSINGKVKIDPESSVYGDIISGEGDVSRRRDRTRRWKMYTENFDYTGSATYNRVDGLCLMPGVKYTSADSVIPSFYIRGGYAFSSERWRYDLGLTQTLLKGRFPLQAGGSIYRRLASDDDKLISETENTFFALVVNEDWKDYYEAEGAYGFLRLNFMRFSDLEIGYRAEEQNWLSAHPKLWSLFGTKEFRRNFSVVPYELRSAVIASDFDNCQVNSLNFTLNLDTRDDENEPGIGWYGTAKYEYSPENFNGDFDFKRLEIMMKRYQPLNRYNLFIVRAAYGRVSGDKIPVNRMFTLGGLGTLHGYKHKEYLGQEYFMAGTEYRYRVPHTSIMPFILYEFGKIASDKFGGGEEWKHALGVGVAYEQKIKIFMSRRLDSGEKDPIFYARIGIIPF